MSAMDLIRSGSAGPVPNAFAVIRDSGRTDWQNATPTDEQDRKWYTVGYELRDDYALTDPVSMLTPIEQRFWWALGLTDAKSDRPRRATWNKDEQNEKSPSVQVPWGAVAAGAAAGVAVLLLVASASGRKE